MYGVREGESMGWTEVDLIKGMRETELGDLADRPRKRKRSRKRVKVSERSNRRAITSHNHHDQ